jgi:hypothetical protein
VGAAFSPSKRFDVFAFCSFDAFNEADKKYPNLRNANYFGPGLPEPWKISQVIEWAADGSR